MIAKKLANYAYNLKYEDLNKDAIHAVKRHFIDALGCAIGAKNELPIKIIRKSLTHLHAERNALLYGAMIRYLDYNDTYLGKEPAHPSDNFGGILATAEANKSKARDFITAAALGYEIQCRLCDAASLRAHGWDHVIYGAMSQALAVGKIMKLNQNQLLQALNLNLSTNLSTRQVRESTDLSMWKAAAFSNVARNAVLFSKLSKNGMTGPNEIIEGKYGIMRMLTGKFKLSFCCNLNAFGKRKSRFKIQDCWLKNWPAEIHSQSVINCALDLRDQIPNLDKIKKIKIRTHEAGYTIIGSGPEKWKPKTRETADHSIPYLVGSALYYGNINKNVFTKKALTNKKVLDIVSKVEVKEDKKLTKLYPGAAANEMTIYIKGSKNLKKKILYHRGHPKNPMTEKEIEAKFHRLASRYLNKTKRDKIINSVWNMDKTNTFNWSVLRKI